MDLLFLFAQVAEPIESADDFPWPLATFLIGFFFAVTVITSVAVWQGLATWRSRMSIAREEAYRNLSQDLARFQSRIADSLERTNSELTEIRQRASELERILKEVG